MYIELILSLLPTNLSISTGFWKCILSSSYHFYQQPLDIHRLLEVYTELILSLLPTNLSISTGFWKCILSSSYHFYQQPLDIHRLLEVYTELILSLLPTTSRYPQASGSVYWAHHFYQQPFDIHRLLEVYTELITFTNKPLDIHRLLEVYIELILSLLPTTSRYPQASGSVYWAHHFYQQNSRYPQASGSVYWAHHFYQQTSRYPQASGSVYWAHLITFTNKTLDIHRLLEVYIELILSLLPTNLSISTGFWKCILSSSYHFYQQTSRYPQASGSVYWAHLITFTNKPLDIHRLLEVYIELILSLLPTNLSISTGFWKCILSSSYHFYQQPLDIHRLLEVYIELILSLLPTNLSISTGFWKCILSSSYHFYQQTSRYPQASGSVYWAHLITFTNKPLDIHRLLEVYTELITFTNKPFDIHRLLEVYIELILSLLPTTSRYPQASGSVYWAHHFYQQTSRYPQASGSVYWAHLITFTNNLSISTGFWKCILSSSLLPTKLSISTGFWKCILSSSLLPTNLSISTGFWKCILSSSYHFYQQNSRYPQASGSVYWAHLITFTNKPLNIHRLLEVYTELILSLLPTNLSISTGFWKCILSSSYHFYQQTSRYPQASGSVYWAHLITFTNKPLDIHRLLEVYIELILSLLPTTSRYPQASGSVYWAHLITFTNKPFDIHRLLEVYIELILSLLPTNLSISTGFWKCILSSSYHFYQQTSRYPQASGSVYWAHHFYQQTFRYPQASGSVYWAHLITFTNKPLDIHRLLEVYTELITFTNKPLDIHRLLEVYIELILSLLPTNLSISTGFWKCILSSSYHFYQQTSRYPQASGSEYWAHLITFTNKPLDIHRLLEVYTELITFTNKPFDIHRLLEVYIELILSLLPTNLSISTGFWKCILSSSLLPTNLSISTSFWKCILSSSYHFYQQTSRYPQASGSVY